MPNQSCNWISSMNSGSRYVTNGTIVADKIVQKTMLPSREACLISTKPISVLVTTSMSVMLPA